jgi:hypothetical protein
MSWLSLIQFGTSILGQWQRILVYGVLILSVVGAIWFHGYHKGVLRLYDYQAKQANEAVKLIVKQGKVTERVVTKYITQVRYKTDVITKTVEKEVVRYVQAGIDSCPISRAGVMLHNSAASNTVPDTAGTTDGTPSEVKASTLIQTCTANYATYHETADRLRALQEWIKLQQEVAE